MQIILNGEHTDFSGHSLADLIAHRQPDGPFAVALNTVFVPRQDYADTMVQAGDAVEIVRPMVGG